MCKHRYFTNLYLEGDLPVTVVANGTAGETTSTPCFNIDDVKLFELFVDGERYVDKLILIKLMW